MPARRKDIDDFEVWWKYEYEGWTQQEIADYYGVSQSTIYWRLHPDRLIECSINWREVESTKVNKRQWLYNNSEKLDIYTKIYRQSEKGKLTMSEQRAKRRELGFIPLNKPFEGFEFHHYDKEQGIYMPAEIHQSISHNLKTGKNMEAINKEAFEFLEYELREEAWEEITGDWIVGEY